MGADVNNLGAGGIRPPDLRELLQGNGAVNPLVRIRDLGNVPQDWEDPGQVPPQVGPPDDEDVANKRHHGQVGLPTSG